VTLSSVLPRPRTASPALLRARDEALPLSDASIRRRIAWIWGLLFLNVLPYSAKSVLIPLPHSAGRALPQAALVVATLLAISINRRVLVRPSLFLLIMSLLAVTSAMMSVRGYFGLGSILRAARLADIVAVLWLLTPWWGRRDLLFLRYHRRALAVVVLSVGVGAILFHGKAFSEGGPGRLGGVIWPVESTLAAHMAALLAGLTIVSWFADLIRPRTAAIVAGLSVVVLVLTHTRTALVGLLVGLLVAGVSLFLSRQRVRKVFAVTIMAGGLIALSFAPFLTSWFLRGETNTDFTSLTGRVNVWTELTAQPRTEVNTIFGFGMSNDSFGGRPIDSSWYAAYLNQGLFGDVADGAGLLVLLLIAVLSPRGPRRAFALFIVTLSFVESLTQTGLGEASPYLLDLAVAASVLMMPISGPAEPVALEPGPGRASAELSSATDPGQ
jgi:hypothetical protein